MVIEAWYAPPDPATLPDQRRFLVRVLSSPAGEMAVEDGVPFAFDRRQLHDRLQLLERRGLDRAGLIAFGRELAAWLLPPPIDAGTPGMRDLLALSLTKAGQDGGLRLRLRLPPLLAEIPWEYLYLDQPGGGDGMDGFLALNPRVAIVRHEPLPQEIPEVQTAADDALKVVAALASAADLPPLNLAQERRDLEQALGAQPAVAPVFLDQATLDEILAAIPGTSVFHFAGHGEFRLDMGERPRTYIGTGLLALADRRVTAEDLAVNLRGNGVRLAVLGGCETGRRGGINVWGGVAPTLIKYAIPAVVANQFSISDTCAVAFSKHFYQALVGGLPIERAITAGRLAAYNADPSGRDWGVAVLYMRAHDGQIFSGVANTALRDQARAATEHTISQWHTIVTNGGSAVIGDIRSQGNTNIGNTTVGSDLVQGDKVEGDKVGGDRLSVGNITGSSGIAIGSGAQASVTTGLRGNELATLFQAIHQQIQARPHDAAVDKAELTTTVERIQQEVAKNDEANPIKVERWIGGLTETAPEIANAVVSGLRSASARLGSAIRQLVDRLG